MPFTPFHFGVGFAVKAVLPRYFFLGLFLALQVVIDLESLYNLIYQRYPVHRLLHTFLGATLLALLTSAVVFGLVVRWKTGSGRRGRLFASILATSLFATWSHVVLDAIMHADVRPFWPWTDFNPLLSLVSMGALHLGCMAAGFFGLVALALQWSLRERP